MKTTTLFYSLLLFLFISLSSCTSQAELSTEEAMTILTKEFKASCNKRLLLSFNSLDKNYDKYMAHVPVAEADGLITVNKRFISHFGGGGRYEVSLRPTKTMKSEYFVGHKKYRIADGYVTEILGISHIENTNKATVRFRYKYRNNDLYYLRGRKEECTTESLEDEATFTLYDTGWKLDK